MQVIFFLLALISIASCSSNGQLFKGDYYFVMNDGEVNKLSQRNDTLFEYKCYTHRPCNRTPSNHYKVLDVESKSNSLVFKLEKLDTLQLPKRYPENRYSILVMRTIDSNRISFVKQLYGLSKKEVTTDFLDTFRTENKFGFTYFSSNYYESFKKLKPITNKTEVEGIMAHLQTEKFIKIVDLYKQSHPSDMYASGLSAELFNQACIDKGYNPIGAGILVNELMRK